MPRIRFPQRDLSRPGQAYTKLPALALALQYLAPRTEYHVLARPSNHAFAGMREAKGRTGPPWASGPVDHTITATAHVTRKMFLHKQIKVNNLILLDMHLICKVMPDMSQPNATVHIQKCQQIALIQNLCTILTRSPFTTASPFACCPHPGARGACQRPGTADGARGPCPCGGTQTRPCQSSAGGWAYRGRGRTCR